MRTQTEVIPAGQPGALENALEVLKQGNLVAFPTDTVYGVGALAFDDRAVEKLYQAKQRDESKAIPVLLGDAGDLALVARDLTPIVQQLAEHFWPGALTLVVPKASGLPEHVTPYDTLGVRVPDHPVALSLLRLAGPLAVTSANISGADNTTTAQDVLRQLGGRVALILDGGQTPGGSPSTVVDCTAQPLKILRQGPVSEAEILHYLNAS
jgi:L-threonylcarbamoyladenylate synthase